MSAVIADAPASAPPGVAVRVLVIDSRVDRRGIMSHVVELCGDDVAVVGHAESPISAVEGVDHFGANVALVEIQLPTDQGLATISALRDSHPMLRIIVCSFHKDEATKRSALSRGADAYVAKPISPRDLYRVLRPQELATAASQG
jgi:DNA-binding NarL/FixJ family response regulator